MPVCSSNFLARSISGGWFQPSMAMLVSAMFCLCPVVLVGPAGAGVLVGPAAEVVSVGPAAAVVLVGPAAAAVVSVGAAAALVAVGAVAAGVLVAASPPQAASRLPNIITATTAK